MIFLFYCYENAHLFLLHLFLLILQDIVGNIKRIAEFLGRTLTNDKISAIVDHCSFKKMSKNETVGLSDDATTGGKGTGFFRKGIMLNKNIIFKYLKNLVQVFIIYFVYNFYLKLALFLIFNDNCL